MVGTSRFARWFGWNPDRPLDQDTDPADVGTAFGMELSFGPADDRNHVSAEAKNAGPVPRPKHTDD